MILACNCLLIHPMSKRSYEDFHACFPPSRIAYEQTSYFGGRNAVLPCTQLRKPNRSTHFFASYLTFSPPIQCLTFSTTNNVLALNFFAFKIWLYIVCVTVLADLYNSVLFGN
jgi:hypothetical protein